MHILGNMPRGTIVRSFLFILICLLVASIATQWYGIYIIQSNKILQRHLRGLNKVEIGSSSWDFTQCTDSNIINTVIDRTEDLRIFEHLCERIYKPLNKETQPELCKSCRYKQPVFMKTKKPFVALASFTGAGNSWTRELLEALTGIYTGSIYGDPAGDFEGSSRCPHRGGVYIIKTHSTHNLTKMKDCQLIGAHTIDYERAIHIIRNPYEAILSTFNLIKGKSKTGFADIETFMSPRWPFYVRRIVNYWARMTEYWTQNFTRPTYVLVYERLKTDTYQELYKISRFLDLDSTYLDLFCAKNCLKPKYHRVDKPDWMNISILYDQQLKQAVNTRIFQLANKVKQKSRDLVPELKNYIQV
ncbi:hypothetical protein ACF0H5_018040 [Mactra antiquata]